MKDDTELTDEVNALSDGLKTKLTDLCTTDTSHMMPSERPLPGMGNMAGMMDMGNMAGMVDMGNMAAGMMDMGNMAGMADMAGMDDKDQR